MTEAGNRRETVGGGVQGVKDEKYFASVRVEFLDINMHEPLFFRKRRR